MAQSLFPQFPLERLETIRLYQIECNQCSSNVIIAQNENYYTCGIRGLKTKSLTRQTSYTQSRYICFNKNERVVMYSSTYIKVENRSYYL